MKKIIYSIALVSIMVLTSCTSTYYQVYKVTPAENNVLKKNSGLVYEDPNCIVTYNLWGNNGDFSFTFYNKTNDPISINMGESFYINNDRAFNYYKNREFNTTQGSSVGTSQVTSIGAAIFGINNFGLPQSAKAGKSKAVNVTGMSSSSVTTKEELIISIPPKSFKKIDEYTINSLVYRDCELFLYPSKNQIKTLNFSESNSPIVFSNRIKYMVGENSSPIEIDNAFYVSEISNYPENEIKEQVREDICDQKMAVPTYYINKSDADSFYITYTKGTSSIKH